MKYLYRKYADIRTQIWEADVLLFRGTGLISKLIKIVGKNEYTHVGLASWQWVKNKRGIFVPDTLELIEFREFLGGRIVNLSTQVDRFSGHIDVFRPSRHIQVFDEKNPSGKTKTLNPTAVTNTMRTMTGLPYGWYRIWLIAQNNMLGFRLFNKPNNNDNYKAETYPVCSGAVARSFRKGAYDLVKIKSDDDTEPADIARSCALSYMFTLVK